MLMPISASRRLYLGMCHYYHQTFQNYTLLNPKTYWCFHRYIISQSYLVFSLSAQGAGRQCCYTERGNLKLGPPTGGSLNRFNTEAGVPTFSHFFQDHVPFVDCCPLTNVSVTLRKDLQMTALATNPRDQVRKLHKKNPLVEDNLQGDHPSLTKALQSHVRYPLWVQLVKDQTKHFQFTQLLLTY